MKKGSGKDDSSSNAQKKNKKRKFRNSISVRSQPLLSGKTRRDSGSSSGTQAPHEESESSDKPRRAANKGRKRFKENKCKDGPALRTIEEEKSRRSETVPCSKDPHCLDLDEGDKQNKENATASTAGSLKRMRTKKRRNVEEIE